MDETYKHYAQRKKLGAPLVIQWLRHCALIAGGPGLIPGQGTRSHVSQLKMLHTTTKTNK